MLTRGSINEVTFDPAKCKGYPRQAAKYLSQGFGANTDYQLQVASGVACPFENTGYTNDYPKATYTKGERVCLAWPAKNHVASEQNPGMPDSGTTIVGKKWTGTDPKNVTEFTHTWADFGSSPIMDELMALDYAYPRRGFHNCPDYEKNPDIATCTQCFDIPTNVPEGTYTFSWRWVFNPANDVTTPYVTCWEADIKSGNAPAKPKNVLGKGLEGKWQTKQFGWEEATGSSEAQATRTVTVQPPAATSA
ncbi:hypothetical protein HK097_005982 [Rhizophlyctis rosea]|uniref:Uncharacterized protein n=1 Tax=Rhizophlyctis rosea TaxID=64517 RepID=A0AAD5SGA9_9FUNG|nr:hypothetical protein HK097_005982 [Rhizophlyctis rosea]